MKDASIYLYANHYAQSILRLKQNSGRMPDNNEWIDYFKKDYTDAVACHTYTLKNRDVNMDSMETIRWWIIPAMELVIVHLQDITMQEDAKKKTGFFLSSLSHELRTPIGTLLTHLEILSLPDISQEIYNKSLCFIKNETMRISRLINNMIKIGRLSVREEIEFAPLDLTFLIEKVLSETRESAKMKNIGIRFEVIKPFPMVMGNQDYIMQVFLNLIDNAIKYSRNGDEIIISLGQKKDKALCTITDTGPGIAEKNIAKVTQLFYRINPDKSEGCGLGLPFVKEILRHHGSNLFITSRTKGSNTGTSIQFTLPIIKELKSKG